MKKIIFILLSSFSFFILQGCEGDCCQTTIGVDKNTTVPTVWKKPPVDDIPNPGSKPGVDEPDCNVTIPEPEPECTIVNTKTKFLGHIPEGYGLEDKFDLVTDTNQTIVWNVPTEDVYGTIETKLITCKDFPGIRCCIYVKTDQNCNKAVEVVREGAD